MLLISSLAIQKCISSPPPIGQGKVRQGCVTGGVLTAEIVSVLGVGVILGLSLSGTLPISALFVAIPVGSFLVFLLLDGVDCIVQIKTAQTEKAANSSTSNLFVNAWLPNEPPPTTCKKYRSDFWNVADFIEQNYQVVVPLRFKGREIAELLAGRPVLLIGESHNCPKHREDHGYIINQLYHEDAILLTESPHTEQVAQTKHVDLKIIKNQDLGILTRQMLTLQCCVVIIYLST